jgi:hypothetical protein
MKYRQPLLISATLAALVALVACGKHDATESAVPSTPPPSMTAMQPPTPAPAATTSMQQATDARNVTVRSVELGSTVDADGKVVAAGGTFAPADTIYASVDTLATGPGLLAAKWSRADGQVINQDIKQLSATGPETTAFMIRRPGGLAAGTYRVEISLDGHVVTSKEFTVQ